MAMSKKRMILSAQLAYLIFAGCSPRTPTLDEEISSLPAIWSGFGRMGASSNNWLLLDRVSALGDAKDKIRYAKMLREHLRDTPDEIVRKDRLGSSYVVREKLDFQSACAWCLISDTNANFRVHLEGWRLMSLWLDDMEHLILLTEEDWHEGKYDKHASQREKDTWNFAALIRRNYELYFKYSFSVRGTYDRLPESFRPIFVEQIKRDFFGRGGMKYVDLDEFPPEFRK